ncbi:MAG: hypothetical protein ACE5HS_09315 [bacterium]
MQNLEDYTSPDAWQELERYLGVAIRSELSRHIDRLARQGQKLFLNLRSIQSLPALEDFGRQLLNFRTSYLRTETAVDFYADAINTRTNKEIGALLRACDFIARKSMTDLLDKLHKPTPPVLCYLDDGVGASILKAGLRFPGGPIENPAATIKVVHHNLYRPTSLIHEAGHQVAHILGWNRELAASLEQALGKYDSEVAETWGSWASEIAADTFAFVHTGYGSVAALHDVVDGGASKVFRFLPGDPHPIAYIRVLLGTSMCTALWGKGPWDELALAWQHRYPLNQKQLHVFELLNKSLPLLPKAVETCLMTPMRSFGGQNLIQHINPERVKPESLAELERSAGKALFHSEHWVQTEALRLLALTALRCATLPDEALSTYRQQRAWMLKLGGII